MTFLDCLSEATFSRNKDILKSGKDDGSLHFIHKAWKYMHVIGYFPNVHRLIIGYANGGLSQWANTTWSYATSTLWGGSKPSAMPQMHKEKFSTRSNIGIPSAATLAKPPFWVSAWTDCSYKLLTDLFE